MEMYNGYLDDMGSPHVPVEFNGRSDCERRDTFILLVGR
eukprot:COSAG04_NODE_23725_length_333_cov_1.089744_2_plen_38_part_01